MSSAPAFPTDGQTRDCVSASILDISVIICTRNRAESLRETLACLARADRTGLQVEIVIVDNGSGDATPEVARSFADQLPIRYLLELKSGAYGKSHSLNCALDSGGLGDLVVVLDDDISVEPDWWHGVRATSRRWPEADLFGGKTDLVWPSTETPAWADKPQIRGWLFSAQHGRTADRPLAQGQWFLGGHFWFRSRVLGGGRRFPDDWFTEPQFMLQLVEDGFRGIAGPDAAASHRVQRQLFDPQCALRRAESAGRAFARTRLSPYRSSVRNARWARKHRLVAKAVCGVLCFKWSWHRWRHRNTGSDNPRFADKLVAVERQANYREALRILWTVADYQVSRWRIGS